MSDADETAKLWKVNRTIHELVRDRVCSSLRFSSAQPTSISGFPGVRRGNSYGSTTLSRSLRQQQRNGGVSYDSIFLWDPPDHILARKSQPAGLLHHFTNQPSRSDLRLLYRGEECGC